MRSKRTERFLVLSALVLCMAFVLWFAGGGAFVSHVLNRRGNGSYRVAQQVAEDRIGDKTKVVMLTHHLLCGHEEFEVFPSAPAWMVDLDRHELSRMYPEWEVEEFSAESVLLKRETRSLCEQDSRNRFVTVLDDAVVVYYGSIASPELLCKQTGIKLSVLQKADREALQRGLVLSSDQEVDDWLEGLSEH